MTLDYTKNFAAIDARANACRALIHRRAVVAYHRALGAAHAAPRDAHLDMCVIHNRMIDLSNGRPCPEVDYGQMRLARYLIERSFEPGRIVGRMFDRQWRAEWDKRRAI